MNFITMNENTKMSDHDWERYLNDVILRISPDRGICYEWTKIQQKVKTTDGDTTNGTQKYRHYVPYQAIRGALETKLHDLTIGFACQTLVNDINALYGHSRIFGIGDLQPPHKSQNGILESSLETTWNLQTEAATKAWINWALEAICDFPDNIFYGPGTDDGRGTLVDVPIGATRVKQLERVKYGAHLLRAVVGGEIGNMVDADGNKL